MSSSHFLQNLQRADALSCLASCLLQVAFTSPMDGLPNLPGALVTYSGEFLLAYAAAVAFISTRTPVPRTMIWLLIAGNLAWSAGSLQLLWGGSVAPYALGEVYLVGQALTVGVLAALQLSGLRRLAPQAAW